MKQNILKAIQSLLVEEFAEQAHDIGEKPHSHGILESPFASVPAFNYHIYDDKNKDASPYTPTSQSYLDRMNSIFSAGEALILKGVAEGHREQYIKLLMHLQDQTNAQLKNLDPNQSAEHKIAVQIIAKATMRTAEILKQAEKAKHLSDQHLPNYKPKKDWLRILQVQDYLLISSKQRNILTNAYPDGHGGFIISYAKPLSNISSLSRHGNPPVLPNFWKTISIHIDSQGHELSRREVYRSASLWPFEEKNKQLREEKAKEIARNEMRTYAFEKIKDAILKHPPKTQADLDKLLRFNMLNMSLQSPLYGEMKSVKNGSRVYKDIEREEIHFHPEQMTALNKLFEEHAIDVKVDEDTSIKPKVVYLSLGTNMVRGDDPRGVQAKINFEARQTLQASVYNKLLDSEILKDTPIMEGIEQQSPISSKTLANIDQFLNDHQDFIKDNADLRLLQLFSEFSHYSRGPQEISILSHVRNQSENNYLEQESAVALAEALGYVVKVHCQSGKDRTFLEMATIEATQIQRDYQKVPGPINKKTFWDETLPQVAEHTTGREIVSINCPGASGVQGMKYPFISPYGFRDKINAYAQDRVSRLHKAPYYENTQRVTNISRLDKVKSKVRAIANQFDSPTPTLIQLKAFIRSAIQKAQNQLDTLEENTSNLLGRLKLRIGVALSSFKKSAKSHFSVTRTLFRNKGFMSLSKILRNINLWGHHPKSRNEAKNESLSIEEDNAYLGLEIQVLNSEPLRRVVRPQYNIDQVVISLQEGMSGIMPRSKFQKQPRHKQATIAQKPIKATKQSNPDFPELTDELERGAQVSEVIHDQKDRPARELRSKKK